MSASDKLVNQSYVDSTVDPELELSPYYALDYIDEDEREVIRYGDTWLPFERLKALIRHELVAAQEETNRTHTEASHDFDLRSVMDDDLIEVYGSFYSGYQIKELLENRRYVLLSTGPVIRHECPEPTVIHEEALVEKPSFWRSDRGLLTTVIFMGLSTFPLLMLFRVLQTYLEWMGSFSSYMGALSWLIGLMGLAWLTTEHLAAKRKQSGQPIPLLWRLYAFSCASGTISVLAMTVLTSVF